MNSQGELEIQFIVLIIGMDLPQIILLSSQ